MKVFTSSLEMFTLRAEFTTQMHFIFHVQQFKNTLKSECLQRYGHQYTVALLTQIINLEKSLEKTWKLNKIILSDFSR